MAKPKTPISEAFHARYIINAVTGCWMWIGDRDKDGYGQWQIAKIPRRIRLKAHRIAWELFNGQIPDRMEVCHHCDNPPCVNPDHLFLGPHSANMLDRNRKGRHAHGERQGSSRLLDADIIAIRQSTDTLVALSTRYKVSFQTISDIKNRKLWKHIEGERVDAFGGNRGRKGSRHGMAILDEAKVIEIRLLHSSKMSVAAIARQFGVSDGVIRHIIKRRTWTHI